MLENGIPTSHVVLVENHDEIDPNIDKDSTETSKSKKKHEKGKKDDQTVAKGTCKISVSESKNMQDKIRKRDLKRQQIIEEAKFESSQMRKYIDGLKNMDCGEDDFE